MPEGMLTYKVCQVNVSIGVQEHVVRFDISVDDILAVYVFQRTSQLSNPEPDRLFREGLPRYVETQITATHQVHNKIPITEC